MFIGLTPGGVSIGSGSVLFAFFGIKEYEKNAVCTLGFPWSASYLHCYEIKKKLFLHYD